MKETMGEYHCPVCGEIGRMRYANGQKGVNCKQCGTEVTDLYAACLRAENLHNVLGEGENHVS